jgi:hypothetical protein
MGANRDMVRRSAGLAAKRGQSRPASRPAREIVHTSRPADMRTRSVDERRPAWAGTATWFAGSAGLAAKRGQSWPAADQRDGNCPPVAAR